MRPQDRAAPQRCRRARTTQLRGLGRAAGSARRARTRGSRAARSRCPAARGRSRRRRCASSAPRRPPGPGSCPVKTVAAALDRVGAARLGDRVRQRAVEVRPPSAGRARRRASTPRSAITNGAASRDEHDGQHDARRRGRSARAPRARARPSRRPRARTGARPAARRSAGCRRSRASVISPTVDHQHDGGGGEREQHVRSAARARRRRPRPPPRAAPARRGSAPTGGRPR